MDDAELEELAARFRAQLEGWDDGRIGLPDDGGGPEWAVFVGRLAAVLTDVALEEGDPGPLVVVRAVLPYEEGDPGAWRRAFEEEAHRLEGNLSESVVRSVSLSGWVAQGFSAPIAAVSYVTPGGHGRCLVLVLSRIP